MLFVLMREQAVDASWAELLIFRCDTLRELEDAAIASWDVDSASGTGEDLHSAVGIRTIGRTADGRPMRFGAG
jgi:hypothetical protein